MMLNSAGTECSLFVPHEWPSGNVPAVNDHADQFDNVPAELKRWPYWVGYELKEKQHPDPARLWKKEKIPVNARTGGNAAVDNPATWAPYEVALAALREGHVRGRPIHGVGYVFWKGDKKDRLHLAPDPFVGIDLDDCLNPETGTLDPWAQEIVDLVSSYTEVSPSGHGVKILARGTMAGTGGASPLRKGLEMYDRGRFFALTGNIFQGHADIEDRAEQIAAVYAQYFPAKKKTHAKVTGKANRSASADLERARDALPYISAEAYELWIKMGMAVHSLDHGEAGYTVWEHWSRTSEKFDAAVCHKKWESFSAERDTAVTVATLFALAKENGWTPNGTGHAPWPEDADAPVRETRGDFQPQPDSGAPPPDASDEAENARIIAQEREPVESEERAPSLSPPAYVWRGIFAEVADIVHEKSWGVWLATYEALGIIANCQARSFFYRPLYGMTYGIICSKTGTGKGFPLDVCGALLPPFVSVSTGVQSGEGLLPILAEEIPPSRAFPLPKPKGRLLWRAVPAILLLPEWSALAKAASIEGSRLIESLNNVFQQEKAFTISRSTRLASGGKVQVQNPMLALFGATTVDALCQALRKNPALISTGHFNRCLTLPGVDRAWKDYEPDRSGVDFARLTTLTEPLRDRSWEPEGDIWNLYAPDALELRRQWGKETAEPLMNENSLRRECLARTHFYTHHIAFALAWAESSERVLLPHVEVALAAVNTSMRFVETVLLPQLSDTDEVPTFKAYEIGLEQKILAKVEASGKAGISRREVVRAIAGKKAASPDVGAMIQKLLANHVLIECVKKEGWKGKGNHPPKFLYLPEHASRKGK